MKTASDKMFSGMVESFPSEIQALASSLRELIAHIHPEAIEVVWARERSAGYGIGAEKMTAHYAYIRPFKRHVNLGFMWGTSLNDPHALLQGTGKRLRHIKIRSAADVADPRVADLLRLAVAERQAARGGSKKGAESS